MSTRSRTRRRDALTVAKDLVLFGVGLSLIIKQGWYTPRSEFNLAVLLAGMGITQVPGAVALAGILRTLSSSSQDPSALPPSDASPLSDTSGRSE